jgi:hypothetical protein
LILKNGSAGKRAKRLQECDSEGFSLARGCGGRGSCRGNMWHVITSVYRLSSNFLVQWFEWHRRKIQKPHPSQEPRRDAAPKLNHPSATRRIARMTGSNPSTKSEQRDAVERPFKLSTLAVGKTRLRRHTGFLDRHTRLGFSAYSTCRPVSPQ